MTKTQRAIRRIALGTGDACGEASAARSSNRSYERARRSPAGGRTRAPRFRRIERKLIIAIDGPAGSGKSTTAKALAQRLKLPYIDTGAMYRAATLKAMRAGIDLKDAKALVKIAKSASISFKQGPGSRQRVMLDGRDVTKGIRQPELTKNVFYVAQEPRIRREMVKKQRVLGRKGGAVMEGRDIGTVVFPDADYKFFFDADTKLRARRRFKELIGAGKPATLGQVLKDLKRRDASDRNRKEGPLKVAKDAIRIDTTSLTIGETVDKILATLDPTSICDG